MASKLDQLGRFAFRRRRLVLAVWVAAFVAIGVSAAALRGSTTESFSIPGTESQQAIDLLEERFPEAGGAAGRVVFAGTLDEPAREAVGAAVSRVADVPGVTAATAPVFSPDGRVALTRVSFAEAAGVLPDAVRADVQRAAAVDGLQVEFGGDAVIQPGLSGTTELIGFGIAAIVLAVMFGALVAAGLPLLTALVGVAIGVGGVRVLTGFVELNSAVPTLALMLGLAVGIDYALFILHRHRTQLQAGMAPEASAGRAVGTAGSAVVFAGASVIVALAALTVVGIPFLAAMGLAAAATVAVAVLVAITLVPALLGFGGMRLAKGKRFETRATMGSRWVGVVTRHRRTAAVVCVVALGACAAPVLGLEFGMRDDSYGAADSTNRQAYELVSAGFGPGMNGPLTLVVDGGDVARVAGTVAALDGVASVGEPTRNAAGDTAVLPVIPRFSPSDPRTEELVVALRGLELDGVYVTGQTAVNIDVADQLAGALVPFLAVIVTIAFVLLTVAFRSVVVPLTAIAGFLLTLAATFGAVVAVFQEGFLAGFVGVEQTAPILSPLPTLIIAILFGLAMDYQVFLVSRMREERTHGAAPLEAVTEGFRHGARVVTAAALIMGAVFTGFVFEDAIIQMLGFALAFGILVDAFVVRMTLIPAVMAMLGDRAWWLPRPLERVLPRVDIEGAALTAAVSEPSAGGQRAVVSFAAEAPR